MRSAPADGGGIDHFWSFFHCDIYSGRRQWHGPFSGLSVTVAAVRLYSLFVRWIFSFLFSSFTFLLLLGMKVWCGPNPPGALKVEVNNLLRSQERSHEAGSHVRSHGMVPWGMQGHMWGRALQHSAI